MNLWKKLSQRFRKIGSFLSKFLLGDPIHLEIQYEKLYGLQQESKVKEVQSQNKKRVKVAVLVIILLVLSAYAALYQNQEAILYEEGEEDRISGFFRPEQGVLQENVKAIIDPGEDQLIVHLPARIPALEPEKDGKKVESPQNQGREQEMLRQLQSLMREEIQRENPSVLLPTHTREGKPIQWEKKGKHFILYPLLGILLMGWILYSSRYAGIQKEKTKAEKSVQGDLPLFLNQLVLLLNAGSIFEAAFVEILKNERKKKEMSYFYRQLDLIHFRYEDTKDPLDGQLTAFAHRTDNQDFIRVAGIIRDNLQRGLQLSEKLLAERNELIHRRKKKMEEEIRVKETKLTLPLCLYLLVLITIAIAPAVLTP
jgi:hypothetical protein